MDAQSRNLIASGIEPVDQLLGGLVRGQVYLVHGEAAGKSLFGIKFLIEGLRQNENSALVIRYSPEDAVRRFSRLGYDCLEDVYSGRLVILEYSDDIIQKIGNLSELTPVLRELEWLLGETRPRRLVFDPVTSVLSGSAGSYASRAKEFTEWARSFGATVVLTVDDSNREIVESFEPLVAESFRFGLREMGDRAERFIAFEKSLTIGDQAIEVDPSRGVFLLGRPAEGALPKPPSIAELESIRDEIRSAREQIHREEPQPLADVDLLSETESAETGRAPVSGELESDAGHLRDLQTRRLTPPGERETTARAPLQIEDLDLLPGEPAVPAEQAQRGSERLDELSFLLDDLTGSPTPLDLDLPELEPAPSSAETRPEQRPAKEFPSRDRGAVPREAAGTSGREEMSRREREEAASRPRPPRHGRASDRKIDSALATRAAELLLRPPGAGEQIAPEAVSPPLRDTSEVPRPAAEAEAHAKGFSVLIVEDDAETCDLISQALAEYTLEVVHDGVSALARLISFRPDLVILDFDLPVIDGFKVLTMIRTSLNVPIIVVSGSRMRAVDRVMAAELGADYYLTKPLVAKELKHKARQLIARYRGISSWIVSPASQAQPVRPSESPRADQAARELFMPYKEFAADVEGRVKLAMDGGEPFSIVGCRLQRMTEGGGRIALRLFDIVRALVRETDRMSTNPRNDLVILLANAGTAGAQAFAGRLRERVIEELNQEPSLWMRSFPELEETSETTAPVVTPAESGRLDRRAGDRKLHDQNTQADEHSSSQSDPRESYIDFLERL